MLAGRRCGAGRAAEAEARVGTSVPDPCAAAARGASLHGAFPRGASPCEACGSLNAGACEAAGVSPCGACSASLCEASAPTAPHCPRICPYTASTMAMLRSRSRSGMYSRTASRTSSTSTRPLNAANAPRNAVLGMGRPSTDAEIPLASMERTRGSPWCRVLFTRTFPPGFNSLSHAQPSSVSSRYTTKSACELALRSPMGRSSSLVNARMGAPRRSGPKEGKAKANRPSAKEAAAPSRRAAVNAPCPPRPCHNTSIMFPAFSPAFRPCWPPPACTLPTDCTLLAVGPLPAASQPPATHPPQAAPSPTSSRQRPTRCKHAI